MSAEDEDLALWCDASTFTPRHDHPTRWFDWDEDVKLLATTPSTGDGSREDWLGARERGFTYCGIIEEDRTVARAAVWTYSDERWEVVAVWTRQDRRGRGMAKSTVSFVTAHILDAGRRATLHTQRMNVAMLRAATAVGFTIGEPPPI